MGRKLPATVPTRLGQFLFWIGVPISILVFLRKADFSGQIWIAPAIAISAIILGALLAIAGIQAQAYFTNTVPRQPTQGSFILAAMIGNTGYLGYPITLAIVGKEYFAWALFYDLLGSTFGSSILGVAIASRFGSGIQNYWQIPRAILTNPSLWTYGFGLWFRQQTLAPLVESCLEKFAWSVVALSLVLIGMRLSKLNSWRSFPRAGITVVIKMLLVPLIVGSTLPLFGLTGATAKVVMLQMAMPPAFATLVIAETFNLDRELSVTALAVGTIVMLVTLPVWLWLF